MKTLLKLLVLLVATVGVLGLIAVLFFLVSIPRPVAEHAPFQYVEPSRFSPPAVSSYAVSLIPLAVILGGFTLLLVLGLLLISRLFRNSKDQNGSTADETRIMQEIYNGLSQMDKRIEALETILLERSAKNR